MRRLTVSALLLGAILALHSNVMAANTGPQAPLVMHVLLRDSAITPATVRFLRRALRDADESNAVCLVIELDTPGGVLTSTQNIVTDILASKTPVIVYVSPSGARAASAGLFVTLAGHISAMAPGTRIGAAHPVQIGGLPISPPRTPHPLQAEPPDREEPADERPSAMEEKLVNDTVAYAESLARLRGHNAEWAALAVSESRVIDDAEALQENIVDFAAANLTLAFRRVCFQIAASVTLFPSTVSSNCGTCSTDVSAAPRDHYELRV